MCTLIIYRDHSKDNKWPILIAQNRDENPDRPWLEPSCHWLEHPKIIAGLDMGSEEKGSWIGINKDGVFCTIINRSGTILKKSDKKSRGGLVIKALTFSSAIEAKDSLIMEINPQSFQGFYLVVADKESAQILISDGLSISAQEINEGLHMVTSRGINNLDSCSRTQRHLIDCKKALIPNPENHNWNELIDILSRRSTKDDIRDGMSLDNVMGVSTISSTLIGINKDGDNKMLFAPGEPKECDYKNINLKFENTWVTRVQQSRLSIVNSL